MALLPPDPHAWLDAIVYRIGPAAAFPGRPARLGQVDGSVFRTAPDGVVLEVPTSAAHALSRRALSLADRSRRREHRQLVEFSMAVRSRISIPVGLCCGVLARLATDELYGRYLVEDGITVDELVAAAYELSSLVQPPVR